MSHARWGFEVIKAGLFGALGAVVAIHFRFSDRQQPFVKQVIAAEPFQTPPQLNAPSSPMEAKPVASVGLPLSGHLRVFDRYICAYDRRNRIPLWVMEHLTPDRLGGSVGQQHHQIEPINRKDFEFYEDLGELEMFRTTNEDYLGSGYDRGHMAAAGNYRFEKPAMSQTFILSNIAPQVGFGFNRHAWNDLEKYVRAIARRTQNVIIVTGPLFLPRIEGSKKRVSYEVIGPNNVAVPTHFFKAIAIQETVNGSWRAVAWVMPNAQLPEKVNLTQFQVPLAAVERVSGLKLFPNLPS
ncbi:Endonuclease G mitochondrial [Paragonimus heterotremus]|uniref:Endonuclease n=1 Tax=Paragonimus heterotremus TaxID=100268 RepID=A0A8J4TG25_9TREM|nr:Endonuclease G mitochondrial [Paragonimus heterotremus]